MSPRSRRRKGATPRSRRLPQPIPYEALPQELVDRFTMAAASRVGAADPVHTEVVAAGLLALLAGYGDTADALTTDLIARYETNGTTEALAILLAMGIVGLDGTGRAAEIAAYRLAATGVSPPSWSGEITQPITVDGCRLHTGESGWSMLTCVTSRAGRRHTFALTDTGLVQFSAAADSPEVPGPPGGYTTRALTPTEFRQHAEHALDARPRHPTDDDFVGHPALARLLRSRLAAAQPGPPPYVR